MEPPNRSAMDCFRFARSLRRGRSLCRCFAIPHPRLKDQDGTEDEGDVEPGGVVGPEGHFLSEFILCLMHPVHSHE